MAEGIRVTSHRGVVEHAPALIVGVALRPCDLEGVGKIAAPYYLGSWQKKESTGPDDPIVTFINKFDTDTPTHRAELHTHTHAPTPSILLLRW